MDNTVRLKILEQISDHFEDPVSILLTVKDKERGLETKTVLRADTAEVYPFFVIANNCGWPHESYYESNLNSSVSHLLSSIDYPGSKKTNPLDKDYSDTDVFKRLKAFFSQHTPSRRIFDNFGHFKETLQEIGLGNLAKVVIMKTPVFESIKCYQGTVLTENKYWSGVLDMSNSHRSFGAYVLLGRKFTP
ncbi:MAG: hypothetical protein AABX16_02655 [Nanoarchaeota archaeon]